MSSFLPRFLPARLALAAGAVLLSACVNLPQPSVSPVALYQLRAAPDGLMTNPPAIPRGTLLAVDMPTAPAGHGRDRMMLALDGGRRLDNYAGARWSAPLPEMVRDVSIRTLRLSLPGLIVDDADHAVNPTHLLRVDILSLTPVYQGGADSLPQVEASLRLAVIETATGITRIDTTLRAKDTPEANTLSAITATQERLLLRLLHDALPRIATAVARTPPR